MPTNPDADLARMLAWFSPAFPVGAYSYSHGLEYAVAAGLVRDACALRDWIEGVLRHGTGRTDAILLGCAWRAEQARDERALAEVLDWGDAFRGTAELALESAAQGRAFLAALRAGWPHPRLDALAVLLRARAREPAYPVAAGVGGAVFSIGEETLRRAYLHAFAANLISAGVRLIPLGQSDGVRVLAALEDAVRATAAAASSCGLSDLGTATWTVDWCSARHETQYTRLFRS